MDSSLVEKLVPPTITLFITTGISILVGIYLEKFKNKLIFLKYNISFSQLGTTIQDNYWGNIQVTHNGRVTNNLNFVTINLVNDSNNDVPKDIYLDVWVNKQSQILGYSGNYEEIGNAILLETNYQTRIDKASQRLAEENERKKADANYQITDDLQQEIEWVMKNKKIHLPIFNRNSSAKIDLLVESFDGKTPNVFVSILQTSIKLVKQEDSKIQNKRKELIINVLHVIIYIIGIIGISIYYPESKLAIYGTVAIGLISYFFGRFIYSFFKFIKRMFW